MLWIPLFSHCAEKSALKPSPSTTKPRQKRGPDFVILLWILLCIATPAWAANPFLHPLFTTSMVLQRDASDPVWGWVAAGTTVTVVVKDQNNSTLQTKTAVADLNGRWQANVGPFGLVANNAAYSMVISAPGQTTVTLTDILIGDVYLCSGQSNMGNTLQSTPVTNWQAEAADGVNYPKIRNFNVPVIAATTPQDVAGTGRKWEVSGATPTTTQNFSAVSYFMARELYKRQGVPIGILTSSRGSTAIETWSSPETALSFPDTAQKAFDSWVQAPVIGDISQLYNGMIYPLAPFRVRALYWYQGEGNSGAPEQYSRLLPSLITSWRTLFGQPNMPVAIVEIANFTAVQTAPVETNSWAELRETQQQVVSNDANAVLVATTDIGDAGNIHPPDKQDTGLRAARAILQKFFGQPTTGQGPVFAGATVQGNTIRCSFTQVGGGLMIGLKTTDPLTPAQEVVGGTLNGFAIAGSNKVFVAANATIDSATNTVVVSSPGVPAPLYVRYGWASNPVCNLYNKVVDGGGAVIDGIPAAPFRNDPVYKLNVTSGTGTGFYALNSTQTITATTIPGLTFDHWMGDTAQLASATSPSTTATVAGKYIAVAATYRVTGAPPNFRVTNSTGKVDLAWSAMTNVHYTLKRATSSSGPFTNIASDLLAATAAYSDTTAVKGTTYYYKISASSLIGEGPDSTALTVTPTNGVTSPSAVSGNAQIDLGWTGDTTATSYTVRRGTAAGGPYATLATGVPATSYTDRAVVSGTTYYYVITAVTPGGESPNSAEVSAFATFLPSPMQQVDIGTVGTPGNVSVDSGGAYTVKAGGADIQSTSDNFNFIYKTVTGDCTITARVASLENTNVWAKAGVMIRSSLNANSTNALQLLSAANGISYQWRTTDGGGTTHSDNTGLSAPYWVRLVRSGNSFTAFRSANGTTWSQTGSAVTITMPSTVYVGLALTAHDVTKYNTTVFDNISGLTIQAPGTAPTGLTATVTPASHQATLTWNAAAGAFKGYNIKRGTASGGPYTTIAGNQNAVGYTDTSLSNGTTYYYVISAVNSAGESANSSQVIADLTPPVITVPANITIQATSSSGAVATFSTSATDNIDGSRPTSNSPASGSTFPIGTTTATASSSDSSGNSATKTFTVTVVWPTPSNLVSSTLSETQVRLTWNANSANNAPFIIQRSPQGANSWTTLTSTLPAGSTSYIDSTASSSTAYDYRIQSSGSGVSSSFASLSTSTPAGIGDGIPGSWRYQYFGNGTTLTPSSDTHADPDGDGMDNLQEYLCGTSPTSSSSVLSSSLSISGNDIVISFPSVSGKSYIVQKATSLGSPTVWTTLQDNIPGTGGVVSVTDSVLSVPQAFYRVQLK